MTRAVQFDSATDQRPVSLAANGAGALLMADRTSDVVDVIDRKGMLVDARALVSPVASFGGSSEVMGNADANGDGNVDLIDFELLQRCFGLDDPVVPTACLDVDFTGDDRIDEADTAVFVETLGGP
jgi:hypothetical protein